MHARHLSRVLAWLVTVCGILSAGTAAADRVLFDFEPAYLYQPGYTVKDHDLLFDDGLWHSFYIRGIEGVPGTNSEVQLGHATSADLRNWIVMPPALDAGPEPWDTNRVWAPDIREDGDGWSMYYTGVDSDFLQRMGAASSPDLDSWAKSLENPVVEPDSTVYLWSPDLPVPELSAFRDPFRFTHEGEEHILHTALVPDSTVTAGRRGVIHHLVADSLGGWTDVGPLAVNNNTTVGAWRELESLQLILDGSRWNLFFTYFGIGGVYWTSSDQLDAGWDVSSAQLIDPGVGAEITPAGNGKWILTRHGSATHSELHPASGQAYFVLRADTLQFNPHPQPPAVIPEDSFSQRWPEQQGLAFIASPTFGDNFVESGRDPIHPRGNGYLSSIDLYSGPFGTQGAPGAEVGVAATGMIHSRWFSIAPDDSVMSMFVAGPEDPDCAIRIVERLSAEGEELVTAELDSIKAVGVLSFAPRLRDVRGWRGKTVRLEVTDFSETGWIALDHVAMLSSDPIQTAAPPSTGPRSGRLLPNRPNPFNPRTRLSFEIDRGAECVLTLFDARGRLVDRVDAGRRGAGRHEIVYDAGRLSSGVYFVQLVTDGRPADTRKISLIR
jgi:hypothetical protein